MKTLSDLQPQVVHFYEVSNFGPFDVGNVIVNISWPLQTDEGDWLLYLTDVPYFKVKFKKKLALSELKKEDTQLYLYRLKIMFQYTLSGRGMEKECEIDPQLVNNLKLESLRQSRQVSSDYEYGTGAILDTG